MSLLIQAIPQWLVVYTTCFETMWPESGEKLNDFLGESQGLSVNLDRLCSLLRWPAQPSEPLPRGSGRDSSSAAHTLTRSSPTIQRTAGFPHAPPCRLESWHLPSIASPRSLCLQPSPGSTWTLPPGRPSELVLASVDERQGQPYLWVRLRQETVGKILGRED